jgi:hypothetical protein
MQAGRFSGESPAWGERGFLMEKRRGAEPRASTMGLRRPAKVQRKIDNCTLRSALLFFRSLPVGFSSARPSVADDFGDYCGLSGMMNYSCSPRSHISHLTQPSCNPCRVSVAPNEAPERRVQGAQTNQTVSK